MNRIVVTLNNSGFNYKFISLSFFILLFCLIIYTFRSFYSAVFFIVYVVCLLRVFFVKYVNKWYLNLLLCSFLTLFCFSILVLYYDDLLVFSNKIFFLIDGYNTYVTEKASGFTSFIFNQPIVVSAVLRVLLSFLYPLPEIGGGYKIFLILGSLIQISVSSIIVFGYLKSFRVKMFFPVLLLFTILFLGVVWGTYTFRHFYYLLPFYPVFFFFGFKVLKYAGYFKYLYAYIVCILCLFSLFIFLFLYRII